MKTDTILPMKELRLRKVKLLAHSHIDSKWHSWNFNSSVSASKALAFQYWTRVAEFERDFTIQGEAVGVSGMRRT